MTELNTHPCFSPEAHHRYGRLHIPCAPKCNLNCAFCAGGLDEGEERLPGRAVCLVRPEEAEAYASERLTAHPEITVLGIAGPGEPLYNLETFQVLEILHDRFPRHMLCLGTNGSLLPESAERLRGLGVGTVTVTINTLQPEVSARLTPWAEGAGDRENGELIRRQLEGVERCAALGMTVKVNTVLVPGFNEDELPELARTVRDRGATIQNLMPLRPAGRLSGLAPPSAEKLNALRSRLSEILPQLRSCVGCRADACGLLSEAGSASGCVK